MLFFHCLYCKYLYVFVVTFAMFGNVLLRASEIFGLHKN